jgi:hypothetical protein
MSDSGISNLPNLEPQLSPSPSLGDPADPAWAWLEHYRVASRRRRGRNWHRNKEVVPTLKRHRSRKRLLRPLLAFAAMLGFIAVAATILQR